MIDCRLSVIPIDCVGFVGDSLYIGGCAALHCWDSIGIDADDPCYCIDSLYYPLPALGFSRIF